jgi:hypothetical protein
MHHIWQQKIRLTKSCVIQLMLNKLKKVDSLIWVSYEVIDALFLNFMVKHTLSVFRQTFEFFCVRKLNYMIVIVAV